MQALEEQKKLKDLLNKIPVLDDFVEIIKDLFDSNPTGRQIKRLLKTKKRELIKRQKSISNNQRELQDLQGKAKTNENNYEDQKQKIADAAEKLEADYSLNKDLLKNQMKLNVEEGNLILQDMLDLTEEIAALEKGQDDIEAAYNAAN